MIFEVKFEIPFSYYGMASADAGLTLQNTDNRGARVPPLNRIV